MGNQIWFKINNTLVNFIEIVKNQPNAKSITLNKMAARIAVNGTVASQEINISFMIPRFSVGRPRANPTPITEPTRV